MIIVKLAGALGNQMFQYAAARRLAWKHNTELKLDISGFKIVGPDTKRNYALKPFSTTRQLATATEIKKVRNNNGFFIERVIRSRIPGLLPTNKSYFFEEDSLQFYPEVLLLPKTLYLEGFWQYPAYFADIENQLRDEFTFLRRPSARNKKIMDRMQSEASVSIHIRRGDYVSNKNYKRFFHICSLSYYRKAVAIISKKENNPVFYVFSDDISWAKKHLQLQYRTKFISHNKGKYDFEDMRLMSQCKHNIIANSTFSWWAAWLNANPEKVVIAPKKWFRNSKVKMKDRFPSSWKLI